MKPIVADTGVLSLHFKGDPRVAEYFERVEMGEAAGYVSGVTLGEFYYKTCQKLGRQTADAWVFLLEGSPMVTLEDAELHRSAGLEKCRRSLDLSLADCYALAVAKRVGGVLLTTDSGLAKTRDVEVRLFEV